MPLSWNEIRDRAQRFSRRWADAHDEASEAKPFWIDFFEIFGITDKRVATFELAVQKFGGGRGRADLFWRGKLLVEQKSRGRDLDAAFAQAQEYLDGIAERDLPRMVVVCDFARFRLHDLARRTSVEFPLAKLRDHVKHFGFLAGYEVQAIEPQSPVNRQAAEQMGKLHDLLKASGYGADAGDHGRGGHPLQVLLVRLLFCLFADDTGIFQPAQSFRDWLHERTHEDGSDLGPQLAALFQVLNTAPAQRSRALDEQLAAFPHVNGKLFEEPLPLASFTRAMRETLLDCCRIDWSGISPAIFGALFQSIMDERARRNLGAHYTSEENILKLIKPLFLDSLWEEFGKLRGNRNRLLEFHKKLRALRFLDPACGCGNFLVIAYRELRKLELEVLRASRALADTRTQHLFDANLHQQIAIDVDQFYGIEIEEFPAQIAQVALWLADHQMNVRIGEEFGLYFARIPLKSAPHIVCGNALALDWNDVLPAEQCSYVLGNPPFVGAKFMSDEQRADARAVFTGIENAGLLDFVAAWYVKAARYMRRESAGGALLPPPLAGEGGRGGVDAPIRAAFVSTNSITQGEQVGALWGWLLAQGIKITFAHRTFQWSNEARGVAAVHCVIVGFGYGEPDGRTIYEYDDIRGEPHAVPARNINPYLVDAPDITLPSRSRPICDVPEIGIGNKPIDDGNYLFTTDERDEFIRREPRAAKWFRRWLGADEFLNGYERWCLWLGDCPPAELRAMPEAMKRADAVRKFRLASRSEGTRKLADRPTRFHVENIPERPYLALPEVSSERRHFIPFGWLPPQTLASNLLKVMREATLFHFGILSSTMHNAWVRYTCGRLKSDFRYSKDIVYNNFPWPDAPTDAQRAKIEACAQAVLDARAAHPGASLADLYDPLTMPAALLQAHRALDAAVDAAYGRKSFKSDAERVAFLFERYQQLTSLLPAAKPAGKRKAA
ncbi:MAG: class I SAM-dependent DNA methyltransferase, partial [Betaproteobacteria bacterium]